MLSALHRKRREGQLSETAHRAILAQFDQDQQAGLFHWLPLSPAVLLPASQTFRTLPPSVFLRTADALHLASAAENGFTDIYSNDHHLLAAAGEFGLNGVNVI